MNELAVCVPVTTLWTHPSAPREVDAPAVAAVPDMGAWCDSMDVASRLELHGRTLTQLLLGEPVQVVGEADGWLQVVAPWQPSSEDSRGYPGWLPCAHVAAYPELAAASGSARHGEERCWATVPTPSADLQVADRTWSVSWATTLPVLVATSQSVSVALPAGVRGTFAASDVALRTATGAFGSAPDPSASPRDVLGSARQLLGVSYLWGGTCGMAVDCSGLVHLAFRERGRVVPRDADDQERAAAEVHLERVAAGDLYFFGRPDTGVNHVGFVSGTHRMLHAPQSGARVEDVPLAPERLSTLRSAGRFDGRLGEPGRPPAATLPG
jgi:cell wall-associated NlpC family hydrolase